MTDPGLKEEMTPALLISASLKEEKDCSVRIDEMKALCEAAG